MPPLPSRKELEELKRPELQKLCKVCFLLAFLVFLSYSQDYGVKANLKSDALIELLLDTKFVLLDKTCIPAHPFAGRQIHAQ